MKIGLILILLTAFVLVSASSILARNTTGTMHTAENLRAQLSAVLANEKAGLLDQSVQLAASRARLESASLTANILANQHSAQGTSHTPLNAMLGEQHLTHPRLLDWLGVALMSFIAILVTSALIAMIRRPLLPENEPTNGSDQNYLMAAETP